MAIEREIKLSASPAALARIARGGTFAQVSRSRLRTSKLKTVYWDTPELALQHAGVALRMRLSTDGWTQSLKAATEAGGLHAREELEWPRKGPAPDFALIDATPWRKTFEPEALRAALRPLFTTHVTRGSRLLRFSDGSVAELSLDRGTLSTNAGQPRRRAGISEVEVEHKEGDPQRIYELGQALLDDGPGLSFTYASKSQRGYALVDSALEAPRRAMDVRLDSDILAADAIARIAAECLVQVGANIEGAREGKDARYVHQLRVGVRRLRACAALCKSKGLIPLPDALVQELDWLWTLLGPVRDMDVFLGETWPAIVASVGDASPTGIATADVQAFEADCARHAHESRRELGKALAGPRLASLLLSLSAFFAMIAAGAAATQRLEPRLSAAELGATVLDKRHKELARRGKDLREGGPEARHRVRIAAKKVRYSAEFFVSLYPRKSAKKYLKSLARLQTALGELNDLATVERIIDRVAPDGERALAPYVAGILRGYSAGAGSDRLETLKDVWTDFAKAKPFWDRSARQSG